MSGSRRPRSGGSRNFQITVRFSAEERAPVWQKAEEREQAVAAWIGQAAVDVATMRAVPATRAQLEQLQEFAEACRLLRQCGRLLSGDQPSSRSSPDIRNVSEVLMRAAASLDLQAVAARRAWSL